MIAAAVLLAALAFTPPPVPDHFVTDVAGALSPQAMSSIETRLSSYEKSTGHQVIVWIGKTTGDVPLETWTTQTADHWKIGRKGYDDGAVLFVFMQDHAARIEVGYGLESKLTDAQAFRIIHDVLIPKMRAGDVDGAVGATVDAMISTISPSYAGSSAPPETETPSQSPGILAVLIGAFFGFVLLWFVFAIIVSIVRAVRYGWLIVREGPTRARQDMRHWYSTPWLAVGLGSFSGGGSSGGGGGGFSAGGGSFGGGGASGSW